GVWKNSERIRFDFLNMGEWFSQRGDYDTVYAGKWHLPSGYSHYIPGFRVLHTGISGVGNVGDTAVSRACEGFLRNRSSNKPFLMVASLMQPHDICEWNRLNEIPPSRLPYQELADELPPLPDNFELNAAEPKAVKLRREGWEPFEGKWDKPHWRYYLWSYYRQVEMVDGEIGRLLQALEETGLDKNTLVVFTSDHGEGMAQHRLARKQTAYESSARVPLMVSWPGHIPENKTDTTHLVTGMDLMPTFCDYAGIAPPANMRGKSLKPLLEGKSVPWRSYIVMEIPTNAGRMVRTQRYKYITYLDDPVEQLFDMQDDPGETVNLANSPKYASILDEHKKLLNQWEDRLDIPESVPNADAWRTKNRRIS
ncbi:MAG: sulfatase-like hydrolase/transferase, partial [Planctomycetes bacterium]|nr:sulfatase-like hydrolase/transferase [Planctomycetota bacterium]